MSSELFLPVHRLIVSNPFPLSNDDILDISELYYEWWSLQQKHLMVDGQLLETRDLLLTNIPSIDLSILRSIDFLESVFLAMTDPLYYLHTGWSYSYILPKRHEATLVFRESQ